MENLFKDIDKLEEFFNKKFYNIRRIYEIKSNIVDYYKSQLNSEDDKDLKK